MLVEGLEAGHRHGLVFRRHRDVDRAHNHGFDHGGVLQLMITLAEFRVRGVRPKVMAKFRAAGTFPTTARPRLNTCV